MHTEYKKCKETAQAVQSTDRPIHIAQEDPKAWRFKRKNLNLLQLFGLVFILTFGSNLLLTHSSTSTAKSTPTTQNCTAIKVPISTNLPIKVAGQQFKSPQEYSAAFKPILSVVELPKGYKAVGGGAGFVIACTE